MGSRVWGILYMWVIIENILKDEIIHLILANKDLLHNVSYATGHLRFMWEI